MNELVNFYVLSFKHNYLFVFRSDSSASTAALSGLSARSEKIVQEW